MNREETIKTIANSFKKLPRVKVYLFGSSARGDFHEHSDIDLLFLLPDDLTSRQRVEMEAEICGILLPIELNTDIEISPVILPNKIWNERKTPFTVNVVNDRILL